MKNQLDDLRAEYLTLTEEAKNLVEKIDEEDRDFSDQEKARYEELAGKDGLLDQKKAEIEAAEAKVAERKRLLERKAEWVQQLKAASTGKPAIGVVKQPEAGDQAPQPNVRNQRSRYFKDARDAYLSGVYFQAACLGSGEALNELRRFGWEKYATHVEQTGSKGGYLVPEQMETEVLRYRDEVGIATRVGRVFSMTTDTLTIPEETSRPTVYYPGETGTITESEAAFAQNKLIVKKRAALVKLSRELIADAAISAADYLVETMGYEMAYAMDNELINGDGTSTYGGELGLISSLGSAGVKDATAGENLYEELDLEEWTSTLALLPGKYVMGAQWIMGRAAWHGSVLPLSASAGGNTIRDLSGGLGSLMWLGYPVVISDLMPAEAAETTVALFGNFQKAVAIGDRGDLQFDTSNDRYFETDEIGIKVTHRYDILVHNAGDSSNAGAYVSLETGTA